MKILYVYGMAKIRDIVHTLRKIGYETEEYSRIQVNSVLNDDEIDKLVKYIREHHITHLMSIHLIFNLAMAAYKADIKYISIIWDAPYLKLYTPFGKLNNCWFSVFDKMDYQRFVEAGIPHVIYQPLAVNKDDILKWDVQGKLGGKYVDEISFVGRLYERNLYDKFVKEIPAGMQNYFTSIMEEAAFRWDGVNRIQSKTSQEILDYIKMVNPNFQLPHYFDVDDVTLFENQYLARKLANIERVCIINLLAEYYPLSFYTDKCTDTSKIINARIMPSVKPGEDLYTVFAGSKINLNISIKGIEGGTPQRVLDIMGAGGFALTNYCPETAELFEENKEIVMFKTPEELLQKVDYYLSHDEERMAIAKAGQEKVLECYTYEKKIQELLNWVESEK